jgi:hypothetical protein
MYLSLGLPQKYKLTYDLNEFLSPVNVAELSDDKSYNVCML